MVRQPGCEDGGRGTWLDHRLRRSLSELTLLQALKIKHRPGSLAGYPCSRAGVPPQDEVNRCSSVSLARVIPSWLLKNASPMGELHTLGRQRRIVWRWGMDDLTSREEAQQTSLATNSRCSFVVRCASHVSSVPRTFEHDSSHRIGW